MRVFAYAQPQGLSKVPRARWGHESLTGLGILTSCANAPRWAGRLGFACRDSHRATIPEVTR
jgi:hypothetical protein